MAAPFLWLPEDCISKIISFTSPKDACKAAAVSPAFKSAAESDIVWEQFLPPEYEEIISPVTFSTKKELYFMLCDSHLLLRGGKMNIKLDKLNGKKAYTLPARELNISSIDDPTIWRWTSLPESRFGEVAELLGVWWVDISATLGSQILTPDTNYAAYLVYKLSEGHNALEPPSLVSIAFGFPTEAEDEIADTGTISIAPFAAPHRVPVGLRSRSVGLRSRRTGSCREDGWMELCLGEFLVQKGNECEVRIQVCKTENVQWRKGLLIEGVEVRPK